MNISVYDPPMCCSTGVCGADVDPVLPRFAADLAWLKQQGVEVERYNLAQQPGAFTQNATVRRVLSEGGNNSLPIILRDGEPVSQGAYPTREQLASWAGLAADKPSSL